MNMHKLDLSRNEKNRNETIRRKARLGKRLFVGLCGWFLTVAAVAAIDPFYQSALSEGTRAYLRNDHAKAVKYLRIACFGLLEAPDELAGCLTRLGLVEAEAEGEAAFLATFSRIVEVEERFGGYSQATLSTDERQRFEASLERWIAADTLDSIAAFQPVARRLRRGEIAMLPVKERREELARKIAEEPRDPHWRVMAAELELEKADGAAAMTHLAVALQLAPSLSKASCLWGFSQAVLERCSEALTGLTACSAPPTEPRLAAAVIGCYVEVAEWSKARQLFDQLEPTLQQRAPFRRLAKEIDRGTATAPVSGAQVEAEAATTVDDGSRVAEEPPPLPELTVARARSPEAERRLSEAQKLIGSPSGREVMRGFDLAREVADAYRDDPEAQHLTAELAIRLRRWKDAVQYFQRGGEIDPENAQRLFFYAIALYETGEEERAADILDQCRDRLQESPFVSSYIAKISR